MHAWAWARLRERFEKESGATSFTEVFQYTWPKDKPLEDVWRLSRKFRKLHNCSLSQHAIEHLANSGLQRHGQPEPERTGWQDARKQDGKYLSTVYHQRSPQPMDIGAVMRETRARGGRDKHTRERTAGTDTRQNCVDMPVRMRCKANQAQKSQSRKFGLSLFMTLSAMVTVMAQNTPRLRRVAKNLFCAARRVKIQSRRKSLEHRDGSNFAKVITNFETSQHFQNLMANIERSQNSHSWPRTSRWMQHSQNS